MNRRHFLAATAATFLIPRRSHAAMEILDTRVISHEPAVYHGWPTVARRRDGELWLTWSGAREAHVCPFGKVEAMTSRDDGATWTWPRTLLDTAIDDRDSGVLETAKGVLLVTTFTSLAYEPYLEKQQRFGEHATSGWKLEKMEAERLARWKAAHERLDATARNAELGEWVLRSTDGGRSWSTRIPTIVNSPHGPTQLADGRLLYAGKQLWTDDKKIGVAESTDDGQTWRWLAEIPARSGDAVKDYH